jgi:hypothetical protein
MEPSGKHPQIDFVSIVDTFVQDHSNNTQNCDKTLPKFFFNF